MLLAIGQAGPVIMFVSLLALLGMAGGPLLIFTAHCFFVVVEDTAAGIDRVRWPPEAVTDWLGKAALLAWLVLVWLAPAGILAKSMRLGLAETLVLVLAALWLFLPVGVLSALSSDSRWAVLKPKLLVGMARVAPATLGFYASTALVIALAGWLWYAALTGPFLLIPVASGVGAAAVLIYARLLGRLAWIINRVRRRKRRRPRPADPSPRPVIAEDPWEPPPAAPKRKKEKPPPEAPAGKTYSVAEEDPFADPPAPPERLRGVYAIQAEDRPAAPTPAAPVLSRPPTPASVPPPSPEAEHADLLIRLTRRTDQETVPDFPLLSGVYNFPWYDSSLKPWLMLSLAAAFLGAVFQLMVQFFPN